MSTHEIISRAHNIQWFFSKKNFVCPKYNIVVNHNKFLRKIGIGVKQLQTENCKTFLLSHFVFFKLQNSQWVSKSTLSLYLQQHIGTENEREKKFIFLKEGATDITVETVCKVVWQVSQSTIQDLGLIAETRHSNRGELHRSAAVREKHGACQSSGAS